MQSTSCLFGLRTIFKSADDFAFSDNGNFAFLAFDLRARLNGNVLREDSVIDDRAVFDFRARENDGIEDFSAFANACARENH